MKKLLFVLLVVLLTMFIGCKKDLLSTDNGGNNVPIFDNMIYISFSHDTLIGQLKNWHGYDKYLCGTGFILTPKDNLGKAQVYDWGTYLWTSLIKPITTKWAKPFNECEKGTYYVKATIDLEDYTNQFIQLVSKDSILVSF